MILVYNILECGLLFAFFARIALNTWKGKIFDANHMGVFLFFTIWMINSLLGLVAQSNFLAFYFVHCAFPVTLILCILFKNKSVYLYIFLSALIALNLYMKNSFIISTSYLVAFIMMVWQLILFSKQSKKRRSMSVLYVLILLVLLCCHLIFRMGIEKVNWVDSQYINYFFVVCALFLLTTIALGHLTLPMFLKSSNKMKPKTLLV